MCEGISDNALICGADFDNEFNVIHKIVTKNDINILRKSKYVQSNLSKCFVKIRELLNQNNEVLFCLKKEENLAICDNMDEPGGHYAK